jgi:hypothetical protein
MLVEAAAGSHVLRIGCNDALRGFAVSGRLPLKVDGGLDISRDRVPLTGRTAVARGGGEVRVANRRDVA